MLYFMRINKKYITTLVIMLMHFTLFAQSWIPLGPDDFNQPSYFNQTKFTSIALDTAAGIPYVVYRDEGNSNKATVARYTSGSWQIVGSAGFSSTEIESAQIAIAPDGTPFVVYQTQNGGVPSRFDATVMKFSSGVWSEVGTLNAQQVSSTFVADYYPSIAIAVAPDNTPFVAYGDYTLAVAGTVKKYDGANWVTVGAAGFTGSSQAMALSLAIDQNDGTPYVLFRDDQATTQYAATVMKYDGASWVLVGTRGFSNSAIIKYPSITITSDGIPYVAYQDVTRSGKANAMLFNGANWVNVGAVIGFSTGAAEYVSIAIDPQDFSPYVSYKDVANGNKATVKKFNGVSWVNAGTAGFSLGVVQYTTMAIANDGVPYVVYQDATNNSRATVKKLEADWTTVGASGLSEGPAGYTSAVFGTDGYMYVGYKGSSNKATVKNYVSGAWNIAGNADFSSGTANFISLSFNAADAKPYVAYQDGANSGKATVKFLAPDNAWTTIGTEGFSTGSASYTSLAISTTGTPYIAYADADVTFSNRVIVKSFNGSSWVNTGAQPISVGSASFVSLALSTGGTPYVAYNDADVSIGNKAIVKTYNGSSWVNLGTQPVSAGVATHIVLGIAPGSGDPYICYADASNSNKATVKTYDGAAWVNVGPAGGFSTGAATNLSLSFTADGTPYVAYQDAANGNRLTIKRFTAGTWTTVNAEGISAGVANNISLVIGNDIPYVAYTDGYAWAKSVCSAAGINWVGSISDAWENPLNWSCGILPDANSEVIISSGSPFLPVINSNVSVKKITVNNGASLTVNTGFTLTLTGTN